MFISFIDRATFSGSSQSTFPGLPVLTPQNPQERVQIFPKIINVAVPSAQHSPMLGQLPEVQMVLSLYLSTRPLSSVYFLPVGSFTLIHFGFPSPLFFFSKVSNNFFFKDTNFSYRLKRYARVNPLRNRMPKTLKIFKPLFG